VFFIDFVVVTNERRSDAVEWILWWCRKKGKSNQATISIRQMNKNMKIIVEKKRVTVYVIVNERKM
jgi:hypothetical protein